jgi:mannose-6-phosphate isomerase-like protein (cupin superfamily)
MPQTAGLRSGYVRLEPGKSVGWHTTGQNEEVLVILHGRGEARIEGAVGMPLAEYMLAYIPPATRHNVTNTGAELLEYIYIVAPAAEK